MKGVACATEPGLQCLGRRALRKELLKALLGQSSVSWLHSLRSLSIFNRKRRKAPRLGPHHNRPGKAAGRGRRQASGQCSSVDLSHIQGQSRAASGLQR